MKVTIIAKAASFTDDGYSTLLGFADDPSTPANYIMLSMANQPGEQDLRLGQGRVHIDAGIPHVLGYDLIHGINEAEGAVVVTLSPAVAQKAGIDPDIEILLESRVIDGVSISEAIQKFKDRLSARE